MTTATLSTTVTFKRESLMACWDECLPLLQKHWEEMRHGDEPFDPDKSQYEKGEQAKVLRLYTARDAENRLVGYGCFAVFKSFWRKGKIEAGGHSLWIEPEFRKGWNGIRFMRFCEKSLRDEGVNGRCRIHAHIGRREGQLFELLGWEPTHTEFEKQL